MAEQGDWLPLPFVIDNESFTFDAIDEPAIFVGANPLQFVGLKLTTYQYVANLLFVRISTESNTNHYRAVGS